MGLFRKSKPPTRTKFLKMAGKARARGRKKKAIAIYRQLLGSKPDDVDVHAKLAPLLAANKNERKAAARSFNLAAEAYVKQGFDVKAIALYRQATRYSPTETGLWLNIARLHTARKNRAEAVDTLMTGAHYFKKPTLRPGGAKLLWAVLKISPWHPDATIALAKNLSKSSNLSQAKALLKEFETRTHRRHLLRARWALFRLEATQANLSGAHPGDDTPTITITAPS